MLLLPIATRESAVREGDEANISPRAADFAKSQWSLHVEGRHFIIIDSDVEAGPLLLATDDPWRLVDKSIKGLECPSRGSGNRSAELDLDAEQ